jgi:hypothetical protein
MANMIETKKWYESRGVVGSVLGFVFVVLGFVGYTVSPEEQEMAIVAFTMLGASVANIIAFVGRIKANKTIE